MANVKVLVPTVTVTIGLQGGLLEVDGTIVQVNVEDNGEAPVETVPIPTVGVLAEEPKPTKKKRRIKEDGQAHRNLVAERMRQARAAKGWTQEKTAEVVGVSKSVISTMERGVISLTDARSSASKICKKLGISVGIH